MPTRGKARKIGVRVDWRPVLSPRQKGEFADSASRSGTCTRMPLVTWIALSGSSTPDVHVDAEDDLLARHELEAGDQVAVARARHDPLVLPQRERVRAGRADRQPALLRPPAAPSAAARAAARPPRACCFTGVVAISQTDSISSGLTSPSVGTSLEIREQPLDRVGEIERLPIHDHELLLDAERVTRGP